MSPDGSKKVVGVFDGKLWMSSDRGMSWDALSAGSQNGEYWVSVGMSSDATKILAAVGTFGMSMGKLWMSSNSGVNWTEVIPGVPNPNWNRVAVSSDGAKMVAAVYAGSLWMSSDGGSTWMENSNTNVSSKGALAMSSDGAPILVAVEGGNLWMSKDSGATWEEDSSLGPQEWEDVAMSANGAIMLASTGGGLLFHARMSYTCLTLLPFGSRKTRCDLLVVIGRLPVSTGYQPYRHKCGTCFLLAVVSPHPR